MDRRTTPANGRVAAQYLEGIVSADAFVEGELRQVGVSVLPIWRDDKQSSIERQLVYGDPFIVYEISNEMAFGQSSKDAYVGYVQAKSLIDHRPATHVVNSRATHLYGEPNIKSPPEHLLPFGSGLHVVGTEGSFLQTDDGLFVYNNHVRKFDAVMQDPASVAMLFLGTPYLWGGNSCCGIDCSGLVQASLLACGWDCPGDSDLQELSVGRTVNLDAQVLRGDLFFWKGHVAMALDGADLIHANAHHMAVAIEPIETAINRIAENGGGPVTSRGRV